MSPANAPSAHSSESLPSNDALYENDGLELGELLARLRRGLPQVVALALLGLSIAAVVSLALNRVQPVATTTRLVFSFKGFERGEYPDQSKFQPDDIAAPAVIAEAVRRLELDGSSAFAARIRGALTVEGMIPVGVVKERDRMRVSGQAVPKYVPDEYELSLILPRNVPLDRQQRAHLLNEIVTVYRENFGRNYGQAPVAFGTAFETLRTADFPEYELIFNGEMEQIRGYLTQRMENAKSFRSPSTNMSFQDLMEQTNLFSQIQLNEVLGLIHENGLSRNRLTAKMKMNYYLRLLEEREKHAMEDEKVVKDLLAQTQARAQNVVLGVKSQAARPATEAPVLDQGLIDSLIANDSYNFLVRKALEAGMKVKEIQAEKARLLDLRDNMLTFIQTAQTDQTTIAAQVEKSLGALQAKYDKLIDNIRKTHADYANQQFGDAIRLADSIRTPGMLRPMAIAGFVGGFLGFALGAGLSLLGIYVGKRTPAATA